MKMNVQLKRPQITLLYILIHVFAWMMLFLLPILFLNDTFDRLFDRTSIIVMTKSIVIFYLNFFVLVPKLLLKKKVLPFFASLLLLIVLNTLIYNEPRRPERFEKFENKEHFNPDFKDFPERPQKPIDGKPFRRNNVLGGVFFAALFLGISTSLKLAEEWFRNEKHKEEVSKEKLFTELAFLKAQINPHFLFNSLNSIYSLATKKSDSAPEAIIRLSKIMRYVLDEAESERVALSSEIDHISDYIELQKLRLTKHTKLSFSVQNNTQHASIEPMLLVPFVENAFKYGVDSANPSVISIKIQVDKHALTFKSTNTIANKTGLNLEKESGIGLKNVKRRLDLLYPNTHTLDVLAEENLYAVTLTLKLKDYELPDS